MSKLPQAKSTALLAVLQNQKAIATARAAIVQLQEAIQQQQAQAQRVQATVDDLAGSQAQREDLLADIATGVDRSAELAQLDARVEENKAASASARGERAAIEQTIAGLTRRIERSQAELGELLEARPGLIRALLHERAEALGVEYVKVAQRLSELYRQLKGVSTEFVSQGSHRDLGGGGGSHLAIPSFDLASVQPYAIKLRPHLIVTGIETHGETTELASKERDQLRALGVDLD